MAGKFETHRRGIDLLSRPEEELETAVPSASQSAADSSRSPAAAQLRLLMAQVDDLKSEREVLEHELKSATVDMKGQFLSALAQDGAINEPALSVEKLGNVYGPIQKRIKESIDFQANLLQQITTLNEDFVRDKSGGRGPSAREELLKELAAAHDAHAEVRNNLDEGAKFYNDLTQLLLAFQSKISDFCFARRAEKEELLKDLTSSLAGQGGPGPSAAPGYHAQAPKEPPSRPPPPNFAPPASSAPPSYPPQHQDPYGQQQPQQPQQQPVNNPYLPYPVQSPYGAMPMPVPPYGYPAPAYPPYQQPGAPGQQQPGYPPQGAPQGYPAYPYYNPGYPYAPPRPF